MSDLDVATVQKKAARLRRARREQASLWQHLAHVGSLGWVFILPVLAGLAVGRLIQVSTQARFATIVGLCVGVFAGAFAVAVQIRRSLLDDTPDAAPDDERPQGGGGE